MLILTQERIIKILNNTKTQLLTLLQELKKYKPKKLLEDSEQIEDMFYILQLIKKIEKQMEEEQTKLQIKKEEDKINGENN